MLNLILDLLKITGVLIAGGILIIVVLIILFMVIEVIKWIIKEAKG